MAFKPNIYPIMYWALAYGVTAGVLLFIINLLSAYITLIWFPVFLAGLIFGGWRNYQKQKRALGDNAGVAKSNQGAMQEFREAVSDIAGASQELLNQEAAPEEEVVDTQEEEDRTPPEQTPPPAPPTQPTPPA